MILIDVTVVGVALPTIGQDTGVGPLGAEWVVNGYILAMASFAALGGRVGDLVGKRSAFVVGVLLFALSSVFCGAAASAELLIFGRVIQGLAAAVMQSTSSALVVSSFPPGERGKAMGVYIGIPMLFLAAGPAVGGVIVQYLSWRWVFWVNVPIAVLTLLLVAIAKPHAPRAPRTPIDWGGAALLLLGLPAFVFAIQEVPHRGWRDPLIALGASLGLALLLAFVRRQLRHPHPLLRLRLFADRTLLADALLILLMQAGMTGCSVFGPAFLQKVIGFSPARSGVAMLPLFIPVLVLVHVSGRIYDKVGVRTPVRLGTLLAALGFSIQALAIAMESYQLFALGLTLLGCGIAFVGGPSTTDALSRVPESDRAQASGLLLTFRQVGGTLGISAVSAVVSISLPLGSAQQTPTELAQAISHGYWMATLTGAVAVGVAWWFMPSARENAPNDDRHNSRDN